MATSSSGTDRAGDAASSLASWHEVHDLMAAYLDAVDGADLDRVADLLAHARVVTPDGTEISGREEIRAMYARIQPVPDEGGRRRTKHHLTNLRVGAPDVDGTLVAEAYYFVLAPGEAGPVVLKSGRFREAVGRSGPDLVIREHRIINDF